MCSTSKEEFQCSSNECVKWSYVCDGIPQCSNKADEDCDMCTNDHYICKDSSKINCTLACLTLGYIPCKNYVDRKVCDNVVKKTSSYQTMFNTNSPTGPSTRLYGESFLMLGLCALVIVSLLVLLAVFYIFYSRNKNKKQPDVQNRTRTLSMSSSLTNQIAFFDFDPNNNENMNTYNSKKNYNNFEKFQVLPSHLNSSNDVIFNSEYNLFSNGKSLEKKDKKPNNHNRISQTNHENENDLGNSDYQLYGEPPPAYNKAKYYPKATCKINEYTNTVTIHPSSQPLLAASNLNRNGDDASHIYENIDEFSSSINQNSRTGNKVSSARSANKRGKFQGLKKHSGLNTRQSQNENMLQKQTSTSENSLDSALSHSNSPVALNKSKNSSSPTNSTNLSFASSSSPVSSSQHTENKIKNNQSRFKTSKNNSEQFL